MNFSELYERYSKDVHRFAYYLSGNRALAEDLTSETFVRVLYGRSNLRMGTVKAYLFAIVSNLYRDFVNSQRHLESSEDMPEANDTSPGPYMEAEGRETLANTWQLIQKLPEGEREALLLSLDEDLKYEQIAAILDCSLTAVKVRIYRARLKLRLDWAKREEVWKK